MINGMESKQSEQRLKEIHMLSLERTMLKYLNGGKNILPVTQSRTYGNGFGLQ